MLRPLSARSPRVVPLWSRLALALILRGSACLGFCRDRLLRRAVSPLRLAHTWPVVILSGPSTRRISTPASCPHQRSVLRACSGAAWFTLSLRRAGHHLRTMNCVDAPSFRATRGISLQSHVSPPSSATKKGLLITDNFSSSSGFLILWRYVNCASRQTICSRIFYHRPALREHGLGRL